MDEDAGDLEEGVEVPDVTFEDGEWCGYDEATERSLMISPRARAVLEPGVPGRTV